MARDFLFDIGNVILKFDFSPAMAALRDVTEPGEVSPLERVEDIKHRLESGRMSDDAFLDEAIRRLGYAGGRDEFARIWCEIFMENEPVVSLIERLDAAGHRLYLLSNTSGLHMDYIRATFPVFARFRDGVFSYAEKCEKPQRRIYEIAAERFDLVPEKTIYIDDLPANVKAGIDFGLNTIPYDLHCHGLLEARLLELGVI